MYKKVGCKWSKKNGCQDSGVATCAGRKKKQCRRPRCKWSKKRGCKETGGGIGHFGFPDYGPNRSINPPI